MLLCRGAGTSPRHCLLHTQEALLLPSVAGWNLLSTAGKNPAGLENTPHRNWPHPVPQSQEVPHTHRHTHTQTQTHTHTLSLSLSLPLSLSFSVTLHSSPSVPGCTTHTRTLILLPAVSLSPLALWRNPLRTETGTAAQNEAL